MALNPDILIWAREKAGLSCANAAKVLGFRDSRTRPAEERLEAMERGLERPSRSVLQEMERKYRIPMLVFYLSRPPIDGGYDEVFRTVLGAASVRNNTRLDALIRQVKIQQRIVRDLLKDEMAEPLDFVGSATTDSPSRWLSAEIPKRTGFSREDYRAEPNPKHAFEYVRNRLEASGVFVLLLSNLGSYQTRISVSEFRGFALVDPTAPFVVLNDQDAKSALSFAAFYEALHLWVDEAGFSSDVSARPIEDLASEVAGEILLPKSEIAEIPTKRVIHIANNIDEISVFASERNISRQLVVDRLYRADRIDKNTWKSMNERFRTIAAPSAKEDSWKSGGPDYFAVQRYRLGPALLSLTKRCLSEQILTYTRAARVLGVRLGSVDQLLRLHSS